jgi:Ice-binding-like
MKKVFLAGGSSAMAMAVLVLSSTATYAATSPSLGMAASFGILSSTYTNTASGTTINGDLGYTTGPAVTPTINGTTYSPPSSKYSAAGTDQGSALATLNSQPCTFTFPLGAVDLATDASHGTLGTYTSGVYCTSASSAASIGAAGITLSGGGTFIFRVNGALTTVSNSAVRLAGGASACNVFWTPIAATTLGPVSTFVGTDIDASGITIGRIVTWAGQALAFGGTVSTTADTITVATCTAATPSPTPGPVPSVPPTGASGTTPGGFPTIPAGLALLLGGSLVTTTAWVRRRRA